MNDDIRQMLENLTAASEKQGKMLEEQSSILRQHGQLLQDYSKRFDSIEQRISYLQQNLSKCIPQSPPVYNIINNNAKEQKWTVDDLSMRTWKLSGFHYGGEHIVKFVRDGYAPGGVVMFTDYFNKLYRWSMKDNLTIYDDKGRQTDVFHEKSRHKNGNGKIVWNGTSGKIVELY